MKAAVAVATVIILCSSTALLAAHPQKEKSGIVSAGECNVRLTPWQMTRFKPNAQALFVWVGSCANGFAHGNGVVFQRRKDSPKSTAVYRYAVRYTAVDGALNQLRGPVYIAAPTSVWVDKLDGKKTVEIKQADVPPWARYVLGKGDLTFSEIQAARDFLKQAMLASAPKPEDLIDAGGCRIVGKRSAEPMEFKWRGQCESGLAHGPGYLEVLGPRHRTITKAMPILGQMNKSRETYTMDHAHRQIHQFSGGKWFRVENDQAPQWARAFLLAAPVVATAPAPSQTPPSMPSRPAQDTAAAERVAAEREARFQAALRENEREDREAQRQADAEREEQSRQWMNTMGALAQQGQALKRQRDEQNARRQAERYRIERDNARYRQMRADEDRRWAEQNQRQQQAALDRQRAEQENERQRREHAMAQQRQAQAADHQRRQAEALRRQQEEQRALAEARARQQLAQASVPRIESFFRNNLYYLRNNGSRRVLCQVSAMMASSGIGALPGLQPYQKAVTIWPNSEEAPFSGPVGNPRFFGCTAL